MVDSHEYYHCPVCSKRYKRREHMQRHWASHNASRPHQCHLCSRSFQRLDVLKRHARTCEARALGLLSPSGRRRACDLCVRQKKACSAGQPCTNCERLSAECNYSFVPSREGRKTGAAADHGAREGDAEEEDMDSDSSDVPATPMTAAGAFMMPGEAMMVPEQNSMVLATDPFEISLWESPDPTAAWLGYLNLAPGAPIPDPSCQRQVVPRARERPRYSFQFLDNFTKRTGLVESFECMTPEFREQTLAHFLQEQQSHQHLPPQPTAGTDFAFGPIPGSVAAPSPAFGLSQMPVPVAAPVPVPGPGFLSSMGPPLQNVWLHDPLMIRIHQIIVHVKEVVTTKPRNSVVTVEWSPLLEQKCIEFFSPANVRKCLALYWAVWHPNVNIVHKPTFDPSAANPTLLAAMTVMGASISPREADRDDAKLWFNCVEEMVFTDDDLCSEPLYTLDTGIPIPATQKRKLQALQAAYIVCLYQNWEGTDASKRRIRRYRFGTVVSVARDIGLGTARHADLRKPAGYEFQWRAFVIKEEMIRVFLWIFLLDHAFVTFNNLPPRLMIKEMRIHLARPEACFQAATAEECLQELQNWSAQSNIVPVLTLSEAVEMVCKGKMPEGMHESLAHLGALNLFAVISAVHSLVFQHHNSFSQDGHLTAIRHALTNWKPVWDIYTDTFASGPPHNMVAGAVLTPENSWRRIGFCRHAFEYWLLASVIIDKLTLPEDTSSPDQPSDVDSAQSPPRDTSNLLTRYDQTSMQQVNELIADFQNIQIVANSD